MLLYIFSRFENSITLARNNIFPFDPPGLLNSVLCNQYDDGNSHIAMHADDEAHIKFDSKILTISLGYTKTINFQPKKDVQGSESSITLQHGSVFIMSSTSQKLYKHGIHKYFGKGMRISLSFRDLVHPIKSTLNSSIVSTDISRPWTYLL